MTQSSAPATLIQHLYLTGYRGAGKSTVGKCLASILNWEWIDLDDRIEQTARVSIKKIFEREGETGFRNRESLALKLASAESSAVISLGGGAVLRSENRDIIAASGRCVWLSVDADTVIARLFLDATTRNRRPSLTTLTPADEVRRVLADREPIYRQTADLTIDAASRPAEQIAAEIAQWLSSDHALTYSKMPLPKGGSSSA